MACHWETDDLVTVLQLALENRQKVDRRAAWLAGVSGLLDRLPLPPHVRFDAVDTNPDEASVRAGLAIGRARSR